jgi:hypothetical protein
MRRHYDRFQSVRHEKVARQGTAVPKQNIRLRMVNPEFRE